MRLKIKRPPVGPPPLLIGFDPPAGLVLASGESYGVLACDGRNAVRAADGSIRVVPPPDDEDDR